MSRSAISFECCLYPGQGLDWIGFVDVLTSLARKRSKVWSSRSWSLSNLTPERILGHNFPLDKLQLTGRATLQPTSTFKNCPPLKYLLIGGPDPQAALSTSDEFTSFREFLRQRAPTIKKIFTTCTGALTLASTGLLANSEATINHAFLDFAIRSFPDVRWRADLNWVEGETFWTASGAVAGMDMAEQWVRLQAGDDLLHLSTIILDWTPRDANGLLLPHYNEHRAESLASLERLLSLKNIPY